MGNVMSFCSGGRRENAPPPPLPADAVIQPSSKAELRLELKAKEIVMNKLADESVRLRLEVRDLMAHICVLEDDFQAKNGECETLQKRLGHNRQLYMSTKARLDQREEELMRKQMEEVYCNACRRRRPFGDSSESSSEIHSPPLPRDTADTQPSV